MSELSNLVRQRLASRETPLAHPDPDTLAAYTEQLLQEPERNQVLEHLALCGQCRQVMALSLPEQPLPGEGALVAALPSSARRWRFWTPAFGWAASLASLAIITAVIIELPKKPLQEARQKPASQSAPAASSGNTSLAATPTQSEQAPLVEAQAVPPAGREDSRAGLVTSNPLAVSRASRLASPRAAAAMPRNSESRWLPGEPRQGYLNSQMFANMDANAFNSGVAGISELPSAPPPRALVDRVQITPLMSTNLPLPALVDTPRQIESNKAARTFTASPSPSSRFGVPFLTALGRDTKQLLQRRTSPAITTNSFAGHAMAGSQFNPATTRQEALEIMAAAPLLERDSAELDQSRAFSARALASPGGASIEKLTPPRFTWKVAGGKLWKSPKAGEWVEGFSSAEGIEFSVVRFYGAEVWAGGSNAALAHSRDGGSTWERITLGSSARGTISSIEGEGLRVRVKSSSGQSWSSSDGGKTWILQD